MSHLRGIRALAALFGFFSLAAGAQTHYVLPEKPEWVFSATVGGKEKTLRMPAERRQLDALPKAERKALDQRIKLIENNQALVRRVGQSFFADAVQARFRLTPEYDRTLTEVAVSISSADADASNPLDRHDPILRALPPYTRVHIVMPTRAAPATKRVLSEGGLSNRAAMHSVVAWNRAKQQLTKYTRSTRWIRDTFLVGSGADGKAAIFVPLAYAYISDLEDSDLSFLQYKWHDRQRVMRIPGFLRGGNVAVGDNLSGERVVFLGADEVEQNDLHYRHATGMSPPRDLLPAISRRIVGDGRLVMLPNSEHLFHIDQALSLLAPGVVALISPVDEWLLSPAEAQVIQVLRKTLPQQGFRVVGVPTTTARVNSFRSPVNIVPYIDKTTGKRRALVPRFDDVEVTIDGRKQSLNRAVQRAYESAGLDVVWVEDRFADRGGNLHCALLPLN